MGTRKFRSLGLISAGVVAGIALSLGITAVAQRGTPLPLDELRQFSSVFAAIKNNYVETVTDKKLIDGAISGMLSDLDPHSAYLDADAFKEMQTATQGEFGGLGIEVGTEDGVVKVISPIEDTPAARASSSAATIPRSRATASCWEPAWNWRAGKRSPPCRNRLSSIPP